MAERQLLVDETEQLQNGRVQVVDVHFVFDRLEAVLIGRPVHVTPADSAAGHPHREAVMVVVAAVDLARVGTRGRQFNRGRAAQITSVSCNRPRSFKSLSNAPMAWSQAFARLRWFTSMSSWLSHGWPLPCHTCTKRTPRSISRRAM